MQTHLFMPLYVAYVKARKNKKPSCNQLTFEGRLLDNLTQLSHEIMTQTWQPSPYLSFVALKPKARQIHAPNFSDRVVHHWLIPQLEAIFEPKFIYDSYANRVGKGTHKAVQRLQRFVRQVYSGQTGKTKHHLPDHGKGYYLQCDIANFFNSIHRPTLQRLLERPIQHLSRHTRHVTMQLLKYSAVDCGVRHKAPSWQLNAVPAHKRLENAKPDCGLPIGNLSSQFFANVYMNALDQFVKHHLKVKHYVRYVDDFVLLSECKETLQYWLHQIKDFLDSQLQLTLKQPPICKPIITGIDFLGFVVFPHHIQLRRRVVANLRHKLHKIETQPVQQTSIHVIKQSSFCQFFVQPATRYYLYADVTGYQQLRSVYASYLGHIRHANHGRLLNRLHRDYPYLQGFGIKTKFSVHSWFEPRQIWLWTQLSASQFISKQTSNSFINQQEYHHDPSTQSPKIYQQGEQLCFNFVTGGS